MTTIVYLECTLCGGLGTRTLPRARCSKCGQLADQPLTPEMTKCRLCGGRMGIIDRDRWDLLWHYPGRNTHPHDA